MIHFSHIRLFLLVACMIPFTLLYAQDTDPTPRPSKTPTVPPTETVSTDPTSTPVSSVTSPDIAEPFIQTDLSILSGNVQRPNGLVWHNGMVYASCNGDWTLYEIQADTGSTISYLWGIRNAHTLYAEDDENDQLNLWVPDFQTNELVRVYQRTTETIATDLDGPWGITPYGEAFAITNLLGNNVTHITRDGQAQLMVDALRSPAGVVVDGDYMYIANNGSARRAVEWINVDDLTPGEPINAADDDRVQSLITGLQNTTGLVIGPDEKLYFAYSLGTRGVIGRIDPAQCRENGGCTNDQVEIVIYTDLAAPLAGLAISDDMKLYTHTIFSPDIYYADLNAAASVDTASTR